MPVAKILEVSFVCEGLALEGDGTIGTIHIPATLNQAHQELQHIKRVEDGIGEFPLLISVNHLVIHLMQQELTPTTLNKHGTKKIDTVKVPRREMSCVDDAHESQSVRQK